MADPNAIRYGGAFVEIFAVLDPLDRDLKKGEKMVHDSAGRMQQTWASIASRFAAPLTIAAAAGTFLKIASSMDDLVTSIFPAMAPGAKLLAPAGNGERSSFSGAGWSQTGVMPTTSHTGYAKLSVRVGRKQG